MILFKMKLVSNKLLLIVVTNDFYSMNRTNFTSKLLKYLISPFFQSVWWCWIVFPNNFFLSRKSSFVRVFFDNVFYNLNDCDPFKSSFSFCFYFSKKITTIDESFRAHCRVKYHHRIFNRNKTINVNPFCDIFLALRMKIMSTILHVEDVLNGNLENIKIAFIIKKIENHVTHMSHSQKYYL